MPASTPVHVEVNGFIEKWASYAEKIYVESIDADKVTAQALT